MIGIWKTSLAGLLRRYEIKRAETRFFFLWVFLFFVVLNITCYWLAIFTAHPWVMSYQPAHYTLIMFPVGFLGAVFDTASLLVTVWIARRALLAQSTSSYIAHLSIDLVIAIVATWWVLFVFTVSGWLVSFVQLAPESLQARGDEYESRVVAAVQDPRTHARNIWFGMVMGASALLPTLTHVWLSIVSLVRYVRLRLGKRESLERG